MNPRAWLLTLALPSLVLTSSCRREDAKAKKALQEELEQLRETRLELKEAVDKLQPLVEMAEFVGKQGMLEGLEHDDLLGDLEEVEALLGDPSEDLDPMVDPFQEDQVDDADLRLADIIKQIKEITPLHHTISRSAVDELLENPTGLARGARIVPSIKDGAANGFKLYAIRPASVYTALGLVNGDTIHSINGMELTSPDRALEIYTKVREATRVDLVLSRRGTSIKLRIDIEK